MNLWIVLANFVWIEESSIVRLVSFKILREALDSSQKQTWPAIAFKGYVRLDHQLKHCKTDNVDLHQIASLSNYFNSICKSNSCIIFQPLTTERLQSAIIVSRSQSISLSTHFCLMPTRSKSTYKAWKICFNLLTSPIWRARLFTTNALLPLPSTITAAHW